jgi:hypothetical protein
MLTKLRARLAALISPPAPAALPVRRKPVAVSPSVLAALQAASPGDYEHPKRPERPAADAYPFPELPPGVVPRLDVVMATDALPGEVKRTSLAMDSFGGSWGFGGGQAGGYGGGFWFPGYPYLAELTQISEYRAPCETTATEMTRKWFELHTKDDGKKPEDDPADGEESTDEPDGTADEKSDKIAQIMARLDELKVREMFRRAALLDAEFGRAQIYINIDDADDQQRQLPLEISPKGIKKGSLKSIQCIEPYWSTPYSWNAMYPERPDFYKPTSWYIMGRKTHSDRLLTFIGREVPDLLKPAYNFSGMSLIQLGEVAVNMWLRTRKAVNDLVNNFSIPVLSTNLAVSLQEGGDPGSGLLARLQQFTLTRNNQSVAAVDKETEELKFAEATLASLDKLQAQSQEHMAACWHTPLIKIFGLTPTGLGATGEGEIQVWYDWINAYQISLFEPHLLTLLKVVQCDLFGEIDEDLVIHWVTLDEPTQKELSEIRKSDCEAGTAYINAGVVSPEEERERLMSDPDSGYSNLTGPAPEPQVDPGMEMQLEHDGEQADAGREHEADQAEQSRAHEMDKAKLAAKAKPKPPGGGK